MNITRTARTRRPGFTLIEVLVAAGLCMLIMVVMTQAFAAGIDTFSVLKSTGELQERLAVAGTVLQSDLAATHLENQVGEPLKVSAIRYDRIQTGEPAARPPHRGFFRLQQEDLAVTTNVPEGNDPDGIPSSRATNHILHMTVKLPGTRQDRAFTANLTGASAIVTASLSQTSLINLEPSNLRYCSQWAEVAYFLNPTSTGTTAGGTPLFSLHRRIRVLTKNDDTGISWSGNQATAPGMSCSPVLPSKNLNGPGNITVPDNRLGTKTGIRTAAGIDDFAALGTGDDILLSNVISFEIKANWDSGAWVSNAPGGSGNPAIFTTAPGSNEFPFDNLPEAPSVAAGSSQTVGMTTYTWPTGIANNLFRRSIGTGLIRVFDTWSDRGQYGSWNNPATVAGTVLNPNPNCVPLPIRLKAIQIKLRIYDPKNKLARQITLIQDM